MRLISEIYFVFHSKNSNLILKIGLKKEKKKRNRGGVSLIIISRVGMIFRYVMGVMNVGWKNHSDTKIFAFVS